MTQSPLIQTETTLKKKILSKEEQIILDAKLKHDKEQEKELELSNQYIIMRTCFIDGYRFPEPLPIMFRQIADTDITIRVCASCQSSMGQFTPARITSFITEDEKGVFSEQDKEIPSLEKLSEMTKDEIIFHMVRGNIVGWTSKLNRTQLLEIVAKKTENNKTQVATK